MDRRPHVGQEGLSLGLCGSRSAGASAGRACSGRAGQLLCWARPVCPQVWRVFSCPPVRDGARGGCWQSGTGAAGPGGLAAWGWRSPCFPVCLRTLPQERLCGLREAWGVQLVQLGPEPSST